MRFKRTGKYASGLERTVAEDLTKRKVKFEYEPDVLTYQRTVPGAKCKACGAAVTRTSRYTPDFKFTDGTYCETKGRFTSGNRARMADFRKSRPDVTVRFLFAADNWCTKVKKQRYTDWAKAHGFECAVGKRVPDAWIP